MLDYVIWLDSENAQIFALKSSGIEKSHLKRTGADHHTFNKKDHHGDPASEHFFRDLSVKLQDAGQLLILGPGLAKNHFKTHLETHHTGGLAKKIIGMENSDHPTDNQILATARNFYKTYDLFNDPVRPS
jgi:stalled ribosome rescue protein Dom34